MLEYKETTCVSRPGLQTFSNILYSSRIKKEQVFRDSKIFYSLVDFIKIQCRNSEILYAPVTNHWYAKIYTLQIYTSHLYPKIYTYQNIYRANITMTAKTLPLYLHQQNKTVTMVRTTAPM